MTSALPVAGEGCECWQSHDRARMVCTLCTLLFVRDWVGCAGSAYTFVADIMGYIDFVGLQQQDKERHR